MECRIVRNNPVLVLRQSLARWAWLWQAKASTPDLHLVLLTTIRSMVLQEEGEAVNRAINFMLAMYVLFI